MQPLRLLFVDAQQRVINCVHRQRNPIRDADLAQQFGDVRLHRSLLNAHVSRDLAIRLTAHQQLQHLALPRRKHQLRRHERSRRRLQDAINEQ